MKDNELVEENEGVKNVNKLRVIIKHGNTLVEINCADLTSQETVNMAMQCITYLQKTSISESEVDRSDDLDGQKEYEKLMRSL